jgi:hypothetical protein
MRYFFAKEQHFNFSIIVSIFTSDASLRKIVKSNIFVDKETYDLFRKNKKINKDLKKMIKKEKFLIVTKKKRAYM